MALYDNPQNSGKVIRHGDVIESRWGEAKINGIIVCPTPTTDPAGEDNGVAVPSVEIAHVACVVHLDNGHWLYGTQVTARRVES